MSFNHPMKASLNPLKHKKPPFSLTFHQHISWFQDQELVASSQPRHLQRPDELPLASFAAATGTDGPRGTVAHCAAAKNERMVREWWGAPSYSYNLYPKLQL
jgi:hypothetical protein